jgi:hypothetical protein
MSSLTIIGSNSPFCLLTDLGEIGLVLIFHRFSDLYLSAQRKSTLDGNKVELPFPITLPI